MMLFYGTFSHILPMIQEVSCMSLDHPFSSFIHFWNGRDMTAKSAGQQPTLEVLASQPGVDATRATESLAVSGRMAWLRSNKMMEVYLAPNGIQICFNKPVLRCYVFFATNGPSTGPMTG